MQLDLLASIDLTASSAIIIAALAISFGETGSARIRIASGLSAWFIIVAIMAARGTLSYPLGLGAPGLGAAVVIPFILLSIVVLRSASLRSILQRIPLSTLIGIHTIRILGVSFLILYAAGRLPAPFAPIAGWGDTLSGLVAAPLAWSLLKGKNPARWLIWFWNSFGMLDLVAAIGIGAVSAPGPAQLIHTPPGTALMTSLPWLLIPAFIVPLLASTHLAIFYRLSSSPALKLKPSPT